MSEWYNNILGTGTNIFGAGANSNTDKLVELGLLSPDAKSKAQSQSLMQGLIGTGISYLAQPKNKDYGSSVPYIGKALQSGMAQAQTPFDNLSKDTLQNLQLEKYQAEIGKLNAEITAANFAKSRLNSSGDPEDISAAMCNMVGEVIGTVAYLNALLIGSDKAYFLGRTSLLSEVKKGIDARLTLAGVTGIYDDNRGLGNAIGVLASLESSSITKF